MFKTILVPAGGAIADTPVFETALMAARLSGAHLVFLHIRADVRDVIASMASGELGAGAGMGRLIDDMEADATRLQEAAKSAVETFCAARHVPMTDAPISEVAAVQGVTAEWRTETGRLADCLSAYARAADLMVAGRSPSRAGVGGEVLEAGLMDSGRPLLIAAAKAPDALAGTIAIAWKDTPEAARAVAAAAPFIASAAHVVIVSINDHADQPDKSGDRLRAMLDWHNPHVSVLSVETSNGAPADVLLAEATKAGASLLVMGGYGHSRLREAVFGGFTQRILDEAAIPVLMAH